MTYQVAREIKLDPEKRWALSDKVFFACGACHILAHEFLKQFPELKFEPYWIRPTTTFRGNHVFVTDHATVFDWHGYSDKDKFLAHYFKRYQQKYPGWSADLIPLSIDLTSREACLSIGMDTRGVDGYLKDPLPRARDYLKKFERQHRERYNNVLISERISLPKYLG